MSKIILLDDIFLNELKKNSKNFIEILELWTDPDPTITTSTYRFVSYPHPISYDSLVYQPIGAIRTPVSDSFSGTQRNISIIVDGIKEIKSDTGDSFLSLIRKINISNSPLRLRRITAYQNTTTPKIIFTGYIDDYTCTSTTFQCNCSSILARWTKNRNIPNRLAGPGCQVPFGCSSCGVKNAQSASDLFQVTTRDGFEAMIEGRPTIEDNGYTLVDTTALSHITDKFHFHNGYVRIWEYDTGSGIENHEYKGYYSFIKSFDPSTSTITLDFPLPLSSDESGNAIVHYRATCGHTKEECYKWQNLDNYLGMDVPRIPVLSVASERY